MPILRRPGPPAPRDDMDPRGNGTYPVGQHPPIQQPPPPEPPMIEDLPVPPDPEGGRGGEGPREKPPGGTQAAQSRPRVPTSGAGSVDSIQPFEPMQGVPNVSLAKPMGGRGVFGGAGGLTGGGFGLSGDPTSNQASDPISSLIAQLKMKQGLF